MTSTLAASNQISFRFGDNNEDAFIDMDHDMMLDCYLDDVLSDVVTALGNPGIPPPPSSCYVTTGASSEPVTTATSAVFSDVPDPLKDFMQSPFSDFPVGPTEPCILLPEENSKAEWTKVLYQDTTKKTTTVCSKDTTVSTDNINVFLTKESKVQKSGTQASPRKLATKKGVQAKRTRVEVLDPKISPAETTSLLVEDPPASKKRRLSATTTKSSSSSSSSISSEDDMNIQEMRRQRNRDHARRSRQKKKSLTDSLQQSLDELKAENAKLRRKIHAAIGKSKTESLVKAHLTAPGEKFIQALKKPENRVLDSDAIAFLQGLRMKIPSATCDTAFQVVA